MCALFWYRLSVSNLVFKATTGITSLTYDASDDVAAFEHVVEIQSWMMTMTAGLNVSTCIHYMAGHPTHYHVYLDPLRRRNCVVASMCGLAKASRLPPRTCPVGDYPRSVVDPLCYLKLSSFSIVVMGIISVLRSQSIPFVQLHLITTLDGFADAFVILSMSVNILATSLIAYKAW